MSTPLKPGKTSFRYGTSDGYISRNDTQQVFIHDSEIFSCYDEADAIDMVTQIIEEDWATKVSCSYDPDEVTALVQSIWAKRPKDGEEGVS